MGTGCNKRIFVARRVDYVLEVCIARAVAIGTCHKSNLFALGDVDNRDRRVAGESAVEGGARGVAVDIREHMQLPVEPKRTHTASINQCQRASEKFDLAADAR